MHSMKRRKSSGTGISHGTTHEREKKNERSSAPSIPFKLIFEQAPFGIALIDSLTSRIYEYNARFAEITGRSREELSLLTWMDLTHPDDVAEESHLMETMNTGNTNGFSMEKRFLLPKGSAAWVHMTVTPIWSGSLKHLNFLCMIEDITARKNVENIARISELSYRRLFEASKDGILILDYETGMVLDVNPFLMEKLGYTKADFLEKAIWDIGFFKDIAASKENFAILQNDRYVRFEDLPLETAAGNKIAVEFISNVYLVGTSRIIQCNIRDISERKRLEDALALEKEYLFITLQSIGDGVISTDNQGLVTAVNKAAGLLTGWSECEAIGKPSAEVFRIYDKSTGKRHEDIIQRVIGSGETQILSAHTFIVSKHGIERPIEDSAAPIKQRNGENVGVVLIFRDVSEKAGILDRIEFLSYHDQLTGLYNRRFYEEELLRVDNHRNLPLTIAMGDINGLKLVNDSFGHVMGDALLKKAASVLRRGFRSDDIIARLGGDEFIVLLPKTDALEAKKLLQRITELASKEKVGSIALSISVGLSTKIHADTSIHDTFREAEDSMYQNKLYESASIKSKTVELIMHALYEKSSREMDHSNRVSLLCESIAKLMRFDKTAVSQMRTAGLMHDIGKIGVSENILNSQTGLDEADWKEMRRHPEVGYQILSSVNEFSDIARFILEHHERFDGTGYPKGLKGDEISLQARIIAVADSYDAMTSHRSYRKGLTPTEAENEIRRCVHTQFDPEVAMLFLSACRQP